jgi:glycosyltransferase involved in cell wall biosynthesis
MDPNSRMSYAGVVVQGLSDLGFTIRWRSLVATPPSGAAAIEVHGRRLFIDLGDNKTIDSVGHAWADIYGKVNVAPDERRSIIPLGPLFGLQCWDLLTAYRRWPGMVARGARPRRALSHLRFQAITRLPESAYKPGVSETGYVFHASRDWVKHPDANEQRGRFIEAAKRADVTADTSIISGARMPLSEYIERTTRSCVAFNSPAVHGCLGWKLGEYLALGKAIISTQVNSRLPEPLLHAEHVHYVDDDVDVMRDAINTLSADVDYRAHLEHGARQWYERNLAPTVAMQRLFQH